MPWIWVIRITAAITLLSRAWLYLRGDVPYRAVLWNDDFMGLVVSKGMGITWDQYVSTADPYVTLLGLLGAYLLMAAGIACLLVTTQARRLTDLVLLGALLLAMDAGCRWVDKNYQIGMLIEYALQVSAPLLLIIALAKGVDALSWKWSAKVAAAGCFVGHGLYAVGWHPVPGHFVTMCMDLLRLSEGQAMWFLKAVGMLDFVAAGLLFVRPERLPRMACYYMLVWGFLTASARVLSHITPAESFYGLDPWFFESTVRVSHWSIPWVILGVYYRQKRVA